MHERTAEVARWQLASSSISHVFGRICRSWITLTSIPLPLFFRRTTYPLPQSRHSACPGTYVWLREMLSCISSRMFDGALLFKHGPRHHGWAASTNLHTFARGAHVLAPWIHCPCAFHVELHQRTPSPVLRELEMRFGFSKTRASRYVTGEVYARRHSMWLHRVNRFGAIWIKQRVNLIRAERDAR